MKIKPYILIGVAVILVSGIFISFKPKDQFKGNQENKQTENRTEQQENPYNGLRQMALSVTPDELGLEVSEKTKVYGIVMDWDIGGVIVTISAYETGDASMYLSSGAGIIGGGQHDNVRQATLSYVKLGQAYLSKSKKTLSTDLPEKDCVNFYLLTNKGTYFVQEKMKDIENGSSDWSKLFGEANKVLSELRLTTENK